MNAALYSATKELRNIGKGKCLLTRKTKNFRILFQAWVLLFLFIKHTIHAYFIQILTNCQHISHTQISQNKMHWSLLSTNAFLVLRYSHPANLNSYTTISTFQDRFPTTVSYEACHKNNRTANLSNWLKRLVQQLSAFFLPVHECAISPKQL